MDLNFSEFFNYGDTTPINRIAYSKEDLDYKLKCINALLAIDPSITITIDKIGNICATLPGYNLVSKKVILAGSHTDSVRDGGQYDGSLGVFMAINTMNEIVKKKNEPSDPGKEKFTQFADFKVVIFACEESTRFNKACIGSSYIASSDENYFNSLCSLKDCLKETDKEPNRGTLGNAINIFKMRLKGRLDIKSRKRVTFVDKVITPDEIGQVFEAHIEQSQTLVKDQIASTPKYHRFLPDILQFTQAPEPGTVDFSSLPKIVGAVTSIGKPVRATIKVRSDEGINPIVTASHLIINNREFAFLNKDDSIRTSIPQFQSKDENNQYCLYEGNNTPCYKIVCHGESNHSGGTPMNERYDSNVGMARLISYLEQLQKDDPSKYYFSFLKVDTPKYGMNQIQDTTELYVEAKDLDTYGKAYINNILQTIQNNYGVTFEQEKVKAPFQIPKSNPVDELKDDIRQCGSATAENTIQLFNEHVINKTYQDQGIKSEDYPNLIETTIISKGDPVQTSNEIIDDLVNLCEKQHVKCKKISSQPGHDTAVVIPPKQSEDDYIGKRFLMFISSIYGSHNPNEQTWMEAIDTGKSIFNDIILYRFKQLQRQAYNFMVADKLLDKKDRENIVHEFGTNIVIPKANQVPYDGKGVPELNSGEKEELLSDL